MMSKRLFVVVGALASAVAAFVVAWRRNRRIGTRVVNAVVNPFLLRYGLSGGAHSEIGTLEHVGRVSRITRQTPVRPVPTPDGFRIVVPLATDSQWARNVLAAGHCRILWRERVYELDEPRLVDPRECTDLTAPERLAASAIGFQYMRLHRFGDHPGTTLATVTAEAASVGQPEESITEPLPIAIS